MARIPCFQCNIRGEGPVDPDCPYCQGHGYMSTDVAAAANVTAHLEAQRATEAAHAPRVLMPALERYPVSIATGDGRLFALGNDGTMWMFLGGVWGRFHDLPQPEGGL